ncbi:solute carrier family 35 member E4 [Spea bombifrons]|uniref:solute carrier family 35 member E4 n=1 Tax=Spea bombifrons TaxID=233779 RepID=UPI00234943C5|nr:solute carrier family 35 member E4 [Spea bombifrons]XP_053329527.1 solute carrier family 35 member E4 [Spea bombifrons]
MCLAPSRKDEIEMEPSEGASSASIIQPKLDQPPMGKGVTKLYLVAAVLLWLVTGTTISSLNKWIFVVYNFRYPLFLSSLHMLTAVLMEYPMLRFGLVKLKAEEEVSLNATARFKIFLLSLTFCSSIAFGNLGLSCVQLSLAQMIYTTTPLFTLVLSKVFLGARQHTLKYTAMIPICLGACFSIIGEAQFDQTGCMYLFASTFLRGLKSIQQSSLLKEERIHSVTLLYLMSIPSFCILFMASVLLEREIAWETPPDCHNKLWFFIVLSCLGSVLYNLASFCVITLTSAVTIHVLGNLNLVGNLVLSRVLFGNQLTFLSYTGIGLTLAGMFMYHNCDLIEEHFGSRKSLHTPDQHAKSE